MASEVPAMAQAKPHSSVHLAVGHSPQQKAQGNQVATAAFLTATYEQLQPPGSLGWGTEKHFYPQWKHKLVHNKV